MSKNEVNYTPWGSLSMKNLVNRLSEGKRKRKQMPTDKNLLIFTETLVCLCGGSEDSSKLFPLCR